MTRTLPPNTAQIYFGFCCDVDYNAAWQYLSETEAARATQFKYVDDQHRFIAARANLRRLLSVYLDVPFQGIDIQYGANGKPFIPSKQNIHFSVAHTDQIFLLAFMQGSAIGIDAEALNRTFNFEKLESLLFSDSELQKLKQTDIKFQQEHFINAWTRKEAVLKAKGAGFSHPPNQLQVSFLKKEKSEVLSTSWGAQEKAEWFLNSFDINDRYRVAVAVHGHVESIAVQKIARL